MFPRHWLRQPFWQRTSVQRWNRVIEKSGFRRRSAMKTKRLLQAAVCLVAAGAWAQTTVPVPSFPESGTYRTMGPMLDQHRVIFRHEMVKWRKNTAIDQKLQHNSVQAARLA